MGQATPQEELYRMQRKLYLRNKEMIEDSILVKEPEFDAYEKRYLRKIAKFQKISSQDEMIEAIMQSDIIYVGDYHTCNQSQRSFLRILKAIVKKTKNFIIGMELVHIDDQKDLDKFMNGKLRSETFLEKIGFHQNWVFDLWDNFEPIFDFAKYHNISVKALDATGIDARLKKRDVESGKLIAKYVNDNPGKKIFVFIGDLHLAPEHLPAEVEKALGGLLRSARNDKIDTCNDKIDPRKGKDVSCKDSLVIARNEMTKQSPIKSLILYQNSDTIYWKLAKEGIEDQVEVVKIDDSSFCRMHTPPLIAQQSYINWLENEEGEIDFSDAKSSFLDLADRIAKFLDLKLGKIKDDVEVYTSGDLSFLNKLKKSVSKHDLEIIKRQIMASESYYLAGQKIVYLANLSLNHAAEEAAHFIKSLCSGPEFPREYVDAFYANILHEALGFFGSKVINSKRKCLHEDGFRDLLKYLDSIDVPEERILEYETAYLITEYLKYEKKGKPLKYTPIFEQGADLFMALTHSLGYMLGDKMYYSMKEGNLKRLAIRYMFSDKWEGDGRPFAAYQSILEQVGSVKIPKRM